MKEYDDSTQFGRLLIAARAKHREIRTPADVARHLDISQQKLTNWKKRGLPAKIIDYLADEFSCQYKWLKTGEGNMSIEPTKFVSKDDKVKREINSMVDIMEGEELLKLKSVITILSSPKKTEDPEKDGTK